MAKEKLKMPGVAGVLFSLVLVCATWTTRVEASKEVVTKMSDHFGKALDACKGELNLPDTIYIDFINFWKQDHVVTNRDTGCALLCISKKLDLVDPELKLHHGNAKEFALQHGADENLAKELVDIIHNCGQSLPPFTDECMMALEWVKCFKSEMHRKGMAPSEEVAAGELLAEM